MFWDRVAGVYDLFVNVYNRRVHNRLRAFVAEEIRPEDHILDCAAGTGMLSVVMAPRCRELIATDFSKGMVKKLRQKCGDFKNVRCMEANILSLPFEAESFDKVVAANVIHLLDEPLRALYEVDRVCKRGGTLIIPTYMNRSDKGKESVFSETLEKAGADFKRQFTPETYKQFFQEAGYSDVSYRIFEGRVPCAVALIKKGEAK